MLHSPIPSQLGAHWAADDYVSFLVWAPRAAQVELHLVSPEERLIPMEADANGYYSCVVSGIGPGARYFYRLDGERDRPDPASRLQPLGVHGPSEVVASAPAESTAAAIPLRDYIFYELHVGTFTQEGTLDAVIDRLDDLAELGITAVELMPLAEFPGARNWGYDGVQPYAVHHSYGGPEALRRLVQAAHQRGLAVVLDVVYNHIGPEGNYLREFGPYFTSTYQTPWGEAINFDGPDSDHVRRYFLENARYWLMDLDIDALRLDAVHAIYDRSAYPFLQELADVARQCGDERKRPAYLIGESDLNDARLLAPAERNGYGLDAQWADDFHHALHSLLTGEQHGYYGDFGQLCQLGRAIQLGWVYAGEYAPTRRRRFGNSPEQLEGERFVICTQNHDQVGNRMCGERLSQLLDCESLKLAASCMLLSPFLPLLFMGEEYGATTPFQYFVSHADEALVEAVRQGRKQEFAAFHDLGTPPDPLAEDTFLASKLRVDEQQSERGQRMRRFYGELIRLRRSLNALRALKKEKTRVEVREAEQMLILHRLDEKEPAMALFHFGQEPRRTALLLPEGQWRCCLDSAAAEWGGPKSEVNFESLLATSAPEIELAPRSAVVLAGKVGA